MKKRNNIIPFIHLLIRILYHAILIGLSFYFFVNEKYFISIMFAIPHWITYSFMGTAGLSHELFHNSVFTNSKLNRILCKFFMILMWDNYGYFSSTHWLHHKITLDENDPKSLFKDKIGFTKILQLFSFDFNLFKLKLKYAIQNSFNFIPKTKSYHLFTLESNKTISNRKKVVASARFIMLFHSITAFIFIYFNIWWLIFLINLAPFMIGFFNKFLGYAQHYGLESESHNDYLNNSRTIILSRFWSFFYSNMNYHIEHHMYPHIPYYNLKKVHDELKEEPNYKNLSNGWIELIKELKKQGIFNF